MTYRTRVIAISVTLLLAAFAMSAVFSLMTFDRTYRDEILGRYYAPLVHLRADLERAAEAGLPLDRSRRMARDFERTGEIIASRVAALDDAAPHVTPPSLVMLTPTGRILHSHGSEMNTLDRTYQRAVGIPNGKGESAASTRYVEGPGAYYVPMRILDGEGEWAATLVARIDKAGVGARLAAPRHWAMSGTAFALALVLLNYMLAVAIVFEGAAGDDRKLLRRVLWVSVVAGIVAQLCSAHVGNEAYGERLANVTAEKSAIISEIVHDDVERTLSRGMRLEFLDFRQYAWQRMLKSAPEVGDLTLRLDDGSIVARVSADRVLHYTNEKLRTLEPVPDDTVADDPLIGTPIALTAGGAEVGRVESHLSRDNQQARLVDLGLDAMSATLVALLVFVELLLVAHWALNRRARGSQPASGPRVARDGAGVVMRPAAFTFLLGIDLSMSFVPLHMERLYEPLLGLSKDFVMGLPISVEFLFVGISMLFAGVWIDRSGWRAPFVTGTALAAIGALYSWAAPDAVNFIVARGILGVGYGLTLMSCQAYVVRTTGSKDRASGLAQLFAGIYGGSIAGGVAGAVFAERVGYGPVFLAGGLIVTGVLAYALIALPRGEEAAPESETAEAAHGDGAGRLRRFLTSRTMLGLMLFSSLPASIAAVGFLNYFSPIYLNRIGASQSTIGQVLMLYGVSLVFFGPWVSRKMESIEAKKLAVLAGGLLGAAAFLAFDLFDGILAAVVAVVLLGLSHSLVLSSQSAYALALTVSKELGEGKAISIFRSTSRLGQMLGPVVFSGLTLAGDIGTAITILGYVYVGAALLYWLCTLRDQAQLAEA